MSLWLTTGLLTAFCVLVIASLVMFGDGVPGFLLLLMSLTVGTTAAFWLSMSSYRVGGGRNLIRFYPDRIEVPSITERKPLVFPRDGLQLEINDVFVRYRLGVFAATSVRRGKLIDLKHGTMSRKLSTLVLADFADEAALVEDLRRFAAGEQALGRAGHAVAAMQRNDYDDRLDRELAELD